LVTAEAPIHISNVALVDPKSKKPTRLGSKEVEGKKVRIARKSGEQI
jgi:large subunit ribosomal protein L24